MAFKFPEIIEGVTKATKTFFEEIKTGESEIEALANAAQATATTAKNTANAAIPSSQKGVANGVAALNSSGEVVNSAGVVQSQKLLVPKEITGAYTTILGDANSTQLLAKSTLAIEIKIPKNSNVAYPVGSTLTAMAASTGQVTWVGESGVTVRTPTSLEAEGQWAVIKVEKIATNEWVASGELSPTPVEENPINPEEGASGVVQANFTEYTGGPAAWPYNALPQRSDMFRWKTSTGILHEHSEKVVESTAKCSGEKMIGELTTVRSSDFNIPLVFGKTGEPEETITIYMSLNAPKMHVPSNARSAAKTTSSDESLAIVDVPTNRLVEEGGSEVKALHDFTGGCGYSANENETENKGTPSIPFPAETATNKARSAGGTVSEQGGASAARIATSGLMIRFPNLHRAETNWKDAIPHPLGLLIQGGEFNSKAGMAPRSTTLYGYSIPVSPLNSRLPYIFPAHSGEVSANACKESSYYAYAPPMGAWMAVNWTEKEIEGFAVPSWIKAVYWALAQYGGFFVDVQGAAGLSIRLESMNGYTSRSETYASEWVTKNTDEEFLTKASAGHWTINYLANATIKTSFFKNLRFYAPPPKPANLPT